MAQSYHEIVNPTGEYIIIVIALLTIIVNMSVFVYFKVHQILSSSFVMLAMTLVLVARVTMSVLKLQDILTDDVFDFILHIRLCHILSTYFFSILSVVLFFQWVQTYFQY